MAISLDPQTERHLAIFKTLSDYEQSVLGQAMEQIATEAPTDSDVILSLPLKTTGNFCFPPGSLTPRDQMVF